jgi:hypothetical protein
MRAKVDDAHPPANVMSVWIEPGPGKKAVALMLGLGPDPSIARSILWSVRPA